MQIDPKISYLQCQAKNLNWNPNTLHFYNCWIHIQNSHNHPEKINSENINKETKEGSMLLTRLQPAMVKNGTGI
jgi:hypothetical protein